MKKHIILSLGRSGSNFLANTLNNHPQITNYGEVLGEWTVPYKLHSKFSLGGSSIESYLDYIYASRLFFYSGHAYSAFSHFKKRKAVNFKYWKNTETIGIKEFSMNLKRRNVSHYLKNNDDIFVVNLIRENILKRFISLEKLNSSGLVLVTDSKSEQYNQTIKINPQDILHSLEKFEIALDEHQQMVSELPSSRVFNIRYEDLFESAESKRHYVQEVLQFLNVDALEITSDHRKILSDQLCDVVENYHELEQTLKGTRFERYLDQ